MRRQHGMTLVELVIAIVIIGIAAAALYSAMAAITARSADPMLRQQSLAIAEAYLEEILLHPYLNPGNFQTCQAVPANRADFDDVCDYRGLDDNGARDANSAAIAALANYRVQVAVQRLANWNGVPAMQVAISVTDPSGRTMTLDGYRTCYGEVNNAGIDQCP